MILTFKETYTSSRSKRPSASTNFRSGTESALESWASASIWVAKLATKKSSQSAILRTTSAKSETFSAWMQQSRAKYCETRTWGARSAESSLRLSSRMHSTKCLALRNGLLPRSCRSGRRTFRSSQKCSQRSAPTKKKMCLPRKKRNVSLKRSHWERNKKPRRNLPFSNQSCAPTLSNSL